MKLYLGLLESSLPGQTRIFGGVDGKLVDLSPACAACLAQIEHNRTNAYELAAYYFPKTITEFLNRGEQSLKMLDQVAAFAHKNGAHNLRGAAGERVVYEPTEIRLLPPLQNPEKSFVIGFSDKARTEAMPKAEIPTGYYKLPQTFVTSGAPIVWPKFSGEIDADACIAIVIGKPGRRIPPEKSWDHVAGATLVIDVTARDINKREGLTSNNLLGKNFPSSTSVGPAVLVLHSRKDFEALVVELTVDGAIRQKFALRDCVFSVEQVIAHWSTLGIKPGDWLAIGASMALQGDRLQNPIPIKIGSTIRCASPAIGELSHQAVSSGEVRR
ncbi:MAG TPA: fumarylacetoacetate hydrolase family protein [Candidatus Binatia bacterium]|jgi:acylpyruvate hydrolase